MFYNTIRYPLFLCLALGLYWAVGGSSRRRQNLILLGLSWLFFAFWEPRFLLLLVACGMVDYLAAHRIARTERPEARRALLATSLVFNLGALLVMKYFGFFTQSLAGTLAWFGLDLDPRSLSIVAPIGISFFTLQTVTHSLAVYRRIMPPARSPLDFLAFSGFFPQLAAGPIGRASLLLPQYEKARVFEPRTAKDGLRLILWGYFKKLVVADNLARLVAPVFAQPDLADSPTLLMGAFLFAIQIYCDFSAYSEIAQGSGRLFGLELTRNFACPYFSRDIAEFWRRWHVSLSSWFRDYVFFPLGGNLGSRSRRAVNFLATFTLSGLWHGANWTFVAWGALNGLYFLPLVLSDRFKLHTGTPARGRRLPRPGELQSMLLTFGAVTLAWILFRAPDMPTALAYYQGLTGRWTEGWDPVPYLAPTGAALLVLACEWIQRTRGHGLDIPRLPVAARWSIYAALLLSILLLGYQGSTEFIYAQF